MVFTRSLLLCSALVLAGCGGRLANSVVNPVNWFGNSRSEAIETTGTDNALIPGRGFGQRPEAVYAGQPVDQITELQIKRRPGGALIHVVGVGDVIGYYDARLEPVSGDGPVNGVLEYTLNAVRPTSSLGVGTQKSREINAALFVSDQDLLDVRSIVVKGANNQRSTRR